MAIPFTPQTVTTGYNATSLINSNFTALATALENALSRVGTTANSMTANLDMNSRRIINLPAATSNTEPVTYAQFLAAQGDLLYAGTIGAGAVEFTPSGGSDVDLQSLLNYTIGRTANEISAGVTPTNFGYLPGDPARYGAVGDGSTNDSAALTTAISTNEPVIDLKGKTYLLTTALTFNKSGQIIRNGTLKFNGTSSIHMASITANDVTFENVTFDGNGKQPYSSLIWIPDNVLRPRFFKCTFKNLTGRKWGSSPVNGMYAVLISPHGVVGFEFIDCNFRDIIKYNDGAGMDPVTTAFVGAGFVGGICFLPEDLNPSGTSQTTVTQGLVKGCTFYNIQTMRAGSLVLADQIDFNDADAIRTYGDTNTPSLYVTVSNCTFTNVSKRVFKFRASGSAAYDNVCYDTGMTYPMVILADITDNSVVRGLKFFTSSGNPVYSAVYWGPGPATNAGTLVSELYVPYCLNAMIYGSDASNTPLKNFTLKDSVFNSITTFGVLQSSPIPTDADNITIDGCTFIGNANTTGGIQTVAGSSTGNAGITIKNSLLRNLNINCSGGNNKIINTTVEVTSSSYTAPSSTTWLVRLGDSSSPNQFIDNLVINASSMGTGFATANRSVLLLQGTYGRLSNITMRVPQGLSQSFAHMDLSGNSMHLDGFTYDGPGFHKIGTTVASTDLVVRNAVRTRSGGSATGVTFLSTSNASTARVVYQDIVDFRDPGGTVTSIEVASGTDIVVLGLASKATPAQVSATGGVVTTFGATKMSTTTQAYALSNVATLRTMDAATISAADLADVVGTLIQDLRDRLIVRF